METFADTLPRGATIKTKESVAGIDKFSFEDWDEQFVIDMS